MAYKRQVAKAVKIRLGAPARDWINGQLEHSSEPRLRDRLARVTEYAGTDFGDFVGDPELWVRVVVLLRNRLTHHDPNQAIQRQTGDLSTITESLYLLVMIALLRECDIPDEVIARFRSSRRVSFVQGQLGQILPRLQQYLRRGSDAGPGS